MGRRSTVQTVKAVLVHAATANFVLGLDTVATHVCSFETETGEHGFKATNQDSENNKRSKFVSYKELLVWTLFFSINSLILNY